MSKVTIYNSQKDLKITAASIKDVVRFVLDLYDVDCDEIAVHLVTEKKISDLHADFFNDPSATDCISFPYDQDSSSGYFFLGEVFVCPRTALNYVAKKKKEVYEEVTLYLVHGLLHLLGYDDINARERKIMKREEAQVMKKLQKKALLLSR